jgi:hypothetical protein
MHRVVCPGRGGEAARVLEDAGCVVLAADAHVVDCRHDPADGPFAAIVAALVEAGIPVESADFRPPWPAQLLRD